MFFIPIQRVYNGLFKRGKVRLDVLKWVDKSIKKEIKKKCVTQRPLKMFERYKYMPATLLCQPDIFVRPLSLPFRLNLLFVIIYQLISDSQSDQCAVHGEIVCSKICSDFISKSEIKLEICDLKAAQNIYS